MNQYIFSSSRKIDIVFCIDGTGSMKPCIESIKDGALRFYEQLCEEMTAKGSTIDQLRVKIIVFRDYKGDGAEAMEESIFFELPDDAPDLHDHLASIRAHGGCGEGGNGLEAMYLAINSDFVAVGPKDRQIIVVFADSEALNLGRRAKYDGYPTDMVDKTGLLSIWSGVDQTHPTKIRERNKRLVIYAPTGTLYEKMALKLNRCIFEPVNKSEGLKDISFDTVIKLIAASASSN